MAGKYPRESPELVHISHSPPTKKYPPLCAEGIVGVVFRLCPDWQELLSLADEVVDDITITVIGIIFSCRSIL